MPIVAQKDTDLGPKAYAQFDFFMCPQFLREPSEMMVVYFADSLDNFKPPKSWVSRLGFRPRPEVDGGAKKSRISMGSEAEPLNLSTDLTSLIENEKSMSQAFEERLKQVKALSNYFSLGCCHLVKSQHVIRRWRRSI